MQYTFQSQDIPSLVHHACTAQNLEKQPQSTMPVQDNTVQLAQHGCGASEVIRKLDGRSCHESGWLNSKPCTFGLVCKHASNLLKLHQPRLQDHEATFAWCHA